MGKRMSNKQVKIALKVFIAILAVAVMAITSISVYFNFKRKSTTVPVEVVKPLSWSTDTWDGNTSGNSTAFLSGEVFANRGEKTYTINSASSYAYFVKLTQNADLAREYNYFKDYTIYLNKNIDLAGYEISPIGSRVKQGDKSVSTFQGIFDGGYYTILNGKINGDGLFGDVENAVIKNIGVYNTQINSESSNVGGVVGKAVNTNIENVFFRLGEINAQGKVAGLVGKFASTNGEYHITNSFASTTLTGAETYGLVAEIETEQNSKVTIDTCYYTSEDQIPVTAEASNNLEINNVLENATIEDFSKWNGLYIGEYDHSTVQLNGQIVQTWCDYSFYPNSNELSFDLPILTRFNKVYMTGSCYENVVVTQDGVKNAETLAEAFSLVDGTNNAVSLIVPEVVVDYTAVVENDETITLTSVCDTTLKRGSKAESALIVSGDNSTLIIGETDDTTITLDGNSEQVTQNSQKSGSLIHAQGKDLIINSKLVLQNNINTETSYGGALSIYALTNGQSEDHKINLDNITIDNCSAENGGGIVVVDTLVELGESVSISGCSAFNGGALHFTTQEKLAEEYTSFVTSYYNNSYRNNETTRVVVSSNGQTITGTYRNNSASYGGAIYSVGYSFYMNNNTYIFKNSATSSGGGVYATECNVHDSGAYILNNSAAVRGGGIYISDGYFYMYSGFISTNIAQYGGGIYAEASMITQYDGSIDGNTAGYYSGYTSYPGDGGGVFVDCNSCYKLYDGSIGKYSSTGSNYDPNIISAIGLNNRWHFYNTSVSGNQTTDGRFTNFDGVWNNLTTLGDTNKNIYMSKFTFKGGAGWENVSCSYDMTAGRTYNFVAHMKINTTGFGSVPDFNILNCQPNSQNLYDDYADGVRATATVVSISSTEWCYFLSYTPNTDGVYYLHFNFGRINDGTSYNISEFYVIPNSSNNASNNGGGVYLEDDSRMEVLPYYNEEDDGSAILDEFCVPYIDSNIASNCGGGIYAGSNVSLKFYHGKIIANEARSDGGAIYLGQNSTLDLTYDSEHYGYEANVYIADNDALSSGGGIYSKGNITINNELLEIIANKATNLDGGGICTTAGSTISINKGKIESNYAGQHGGGIANSGSFEMTGGSLESNTAASCGGAIVSWQPITISGGTIYNNASQAGAIHLSESTGHKITDCAIYNNTSLTDGGAINLYSSNKPTTETSLELSGVSIYGNKSSSTGNGSAISGTNVTINMIGGAIYNNSVTQAVGLNNSTFTMSAGTIASNKAGGVLLNNGSAFNMTGGSIVDNSGNRAVSLNNSTFNMSAGAIASNSGGGVLVDNGSTFTMLGTAEIKFNDCGNNGAGVCVESDATFNLQAGKIYKNSCDSDGAGIYAEGTLNITGGDISHNTSEDGGGIYVNSVTASISNATISGNIAISGGGIYSNTDNLTISNCTISHNIALSNSDYSGIGGGIYSNTPASITNCDIYNNFATYQGGGIYTEGDSVINNCRIYNNTALKASLSTEQDISIKDWQVNWCDYAGAVIDDIDYNEHKILIHSFKSNTSNDNDDYLDDIGMMDLDLDLEWNTTYQFSIDFVRTGGSGSTIYLALDTTETCEHDKISDTDGTPTCVFAESTADSGTLTATYTTPAQIGTGSYYSTLLRVAFGHTTVGEVSYYEISNIKMQGIAQGSTLLNGFYISNPDNSKGYGGGVAICGGGAEGTTIISSNIYGNYSAFGGGVYNTETLTLQNVTINDNQATQNGGGLHSNDISLGGTLADGSANNIKIYGNTAANYGGGIFMTSYSELTINSNVQIGYAEGLDTDAPTYHSNTAAYGGGIFGQSNSTLNILGGTISYNTATNYHGGGIYAYNNSTVTISGDTTISNNTATHSGGGIFAGTKSTVNILGGTISNNTATYQGGGIHVYPNSTVTISSGTISHNSAPKGGGIFIETNCTVTISGGTIEYNTATSNHGGGIYASSNGATNCTVNITGGTISNNTATQNGGGIYVYNNSAANISSGIIEFNTAAAGGGIYAFSKSTVTISGDTTISGNTATNGGGGINASGNTSSKSNVTISGNVTITNNTTASHGGGIYSNGILNITGGTISSNTALYGGGITVGSCNTLTVSGDTTISNNTATSHGGGIYASSSSGQYCNVIVSAGTISNNTAKTNGGGIYIFGILQITGGTISNNTAKTNGGGIYAAASSTSNCNITIIDNVIISNNTASISGGGIYAYSYSTVTISGGTIEHNIATQDGGGICEYTNSTVTISGGEISNNSSTKFDGGGIYTKGTLNITGGTISNNTARYGGGISAATANATVTISGNTTISNNTATNGSGGIYGNTGSTITISGENTTVASNTGDGVTCSGSLNISGGLFSGNSGAGARCNSSNLNITGGQFKNNGAGIYASGSGSSTIQNATISDNTGAGISVRGDISIANTTITNNKDSGIYSVDCDGTMTITNTTISNNRTTGNGGGITGELALIISDSTISNNLATGHGAGIYGYYDMTLTNCTISDNSAAGSGGGIWTYGGNLTILNSLVLTGNLASGAGGGIYAQGLVSLQGESFQITGNEATVRGGAICLESSGRLECMGTGGEDGYSGELIISGNIAQNGGAIYVADESDNNYINLNCDEADTFIVTVENNQSVEHGGAIYMCTGGELYLYEVDFVNNFTQEGNGGSGGAIYLENNCNVNIYYSMFNGNRATAEGGAIYSASSINAEGVTFTNNSSGSDGGVFYIGDSENMSLSFVDCTFTNNSTNGYGGAIYSSGGCSSISFDGSCTFTGNSATGAGGAISIETNYEDNLELYLWGCNISNNTSDASGGGLYVSGGGCKTLTVENCEINNNTSTGDGGGLYFDNYLDDRADLNINIINTNVNGNTATDGNAGAYVYTDPTGIITITGGSISNNSCSGDAAGLYLDSGTTTITGTLFEGNSNEERGDWAGAIDSCGDLTLNNVIIRNNSAANKGGAVYQGSGTLTIIDSEIYNNTVHIEEDDNDRCGGAIYLAEWGSLDLQGSTEIYNNTAVNGGGIYKACNTTYNKTSFVTGLTPERVHDNSATNQGNNTYGCGKTLLNKYISSTLAPQTVTVYNLDQTEYGTGTNGDYTFLGWATSSDTAEIAHTATSVYTCSIENPVTNSVETINTIDAYAVYKTDTESYDIKTNLEHTFHKTGDTSFKKSTTKTQTYNGATGYYNYLGTLIKKGTDGTLNSITYETLSLPTELVVDNSYIINGVSYTFEGWSTNGADTTAEWTGGTQKPTANTNYYAVWSGTFVVSEGNKTDSRLYDTVTATFNSMGGTDVDSQSVNRYAYDIYTIVYSDQNHSYDLSKHSGSTSNVVTATKFTLTNSNASGTDTVPNVTISYPTEPTKDGYTFAGWSTNGADSTAEWTDGTQSISASITYYAVWTANTYTITYNTDGGNNITADSYTVKTTEQTKTLKTPSKAGYTFAGYTITTNSTGEASISNKTTLNIPANAYGDITVKANWTANTYTITYNTDGGNSITADSYTVKTTVQTKTLKTPSKAGYTFAGYTISTNSTGEASISNKTTLNIPANAYGDITVTANWTIKTYTISFVSNNTTMGTVSPTSIANVPHFSEITISNNKLTLNGTTVTATAKTGYEFDSWSVANGTQISSAITITATFTPRTDTVYTVKHYQQNIDDDGYTLVETEELKGTTGDTVTPAVKNYTGFNSPTASDLTILADGSAVKEYHYDRKTYTITLNKGDGIASVTGAGTYRFGKMVTINATLEEGYDWVNWTGTVTYSAQQNDITVTKDFTLTANARIKTFTVTIDYDSNYGSVDNNSVEVDYGSIISATDNVLTIGNKIVTATPNSSKGFTDVEWILPENTTVTGNVTITVYFLAPVTVETEGEIGSATYGYTYNKNTITGTTKVRGGDTITLVANRLSNQIVTANVYNNSGVLISTVKTAIELPDSRPGAIQTVNSALTIKFVFVDAYKQVEIGNTETGAVELQIEGNKVDGYVETGVKQKLIVDEAVLEGDSGKKFMIIKYTTTGGKTVHITNLGDTNTIVLVDSNNATYEIQTEDIKSIEFITKTQVTVAIDGNNSLAFTMTSSEGIVKNITEGANNVIIYEDTWTIEIDSSVDVTSELKAIFGANATITRENNSKYFLSYNNT